MQKPQDLIGQRFGRLVVVGSAAPVPRGRKMAARWRCQCDCGAIRDVRAEDLKSGNSQSCGCIQREKARDRLLTHGESQTRLYKLWCQIKQRCTNPDDDKFPQYGGRGIRMCGAWQASYETFKADMGPRPRGASVDRIDGNGHYEPGNCRWATPKLQAQNRRNVIWVEHNGQQLTAKDFCAAIGISDKRFYKVYKTRGLNPHETAAYVIAHRRQ